MLGYIRSKSGGTISVLIIGAIALVFIFWGIGGRNQGAAEDISINGQTIPRAEFFLSLETMRDRLRAEAGELTPQMEMEARRRAISYILERHNLITLARETGREVSVAALNRYVKADPRFQEDGRFSKKLYEDMVTKQMGKNLAAFEDEAREELLMGETSYFIMDLAHAPAASLLDDYRLAEDLISLKYALLMDGSFGANLEPKEGQLEDFFAARKEEFRRPARFKLEYLEAKIDYYLDQVEASPEELEEAYLEEGDNLTQPERAEASHILFRFPSFSPSDEDKAEVLKKANEALERAITEDFAALAQELSQDSSTASKGGDLGEVQPSELGNELDKAIFGEGKDKIGQVLGPLESIFGYHLAKVRSYKPGSTKTLEEAKEELSDRIKRRKARRLAVEKIESLLEAAQKGTGLSQAAAALGFSTQTTDFATSTEPPAFLANNPAEAVKASAWPIGEISEPLDLPDSLVIYQPLERQESYLPNLEDEDGAVRSEALTAWREEQARRLSQEAAQAFIAQAKKEGWDTALSTLPPEVQTGQIDQFPRLKFFQSQTILAMADPLSLLTAIFDLNKPGDIAPQPIPLSQASLSGRLVITLTGLKPAPEEEFQERRDALKEEAQRELSRASYVYWASGRNAAARILLPPDIESYITDNQAQND